MTPALQRYMNSLTCKTCNGHGYLGGRSASNLQGLIVYTDEGRDCHVCQGTGLAGKLVQDELERRR